MRRSLAVRNYRARSPEASERSAGPPSHPAAGIAHPHRPCRSVRRPARCHRRDVEVAENSEDVIDWLLVHQTGSSPGAAQGEEALDASPRPAAKALVSPSRSATVTVSAEWPLRRSGDGTFSA